MGPRTSTARLGPAESGGSGSATRVPVMVGAVIIIAVLVVVIPVGFLMTMSIVAGVLGWSVESGVDAAYEGTEELALAYGTDA